MEEYLESQKVLFPSLLVPLEELGELCTKKLWHQLSVALEIFLLRNKLENGQINVLEFYNQFIANFESRLSPIRLAILVSIIGRTLSNANDALEFYNRILLNKSRLGEEATLCVTMDIAVAKLKLGLVEETKSALEEGKEKLTALSTSETIVFSKYYGAAAEYRKVAGPPQEFYKAALMFLAYTNAEELDPQDKYELATDVALAAATGEGIYNFGEVLATPIIHVLHGTPNQWLYELMLVMNAGDIDGFNSLVDKYREQYFQQPALAAMHESVQKKLVFLCLLNIVFERHSHDRTISFQVIASRTRLPLPEVEWMLMRALSLGLIKGNMDEVDGTIDVSWVQPRVLDPSQLQLLSAQLETWGQKVRTALLTVEEQTPELFV